MFYKKNTCDVTLYAHENFHFHIWGASPKIIHLKTLHFNFAIWQLYLKYVHKAAASSSLFGMHHVSA